MIISGIIFFMLYMHSTLFNADDNVAVGCVFLGDFAKESNFGWTSPMRPHFYDEKLFVSLKLIK